jgi:hypothetical protein
VQIEIFLFERKSTIPCQIQLQKKNFLHATDGQKKQLSPSEWCKAPRSGCIPSFYLAFDFVITEGDGG